MAIPLHQQTNFTAKISILFEIASMFHLKIKGYVTRTKSRDY